jgi:predicted phosphohydrolase
MKAQLLSDIHTEFYPYTSPMDMLNSLEFEPDLDFLLLPGDTIVPSRQSLSECKDVLDFLSTKARHVLFTVGNHEYYGSSRKENVEAIIQEILPSNFTWLDNSEITIEGIHFYGGVLWFPNHPMNFLFEKEMNDFSQIRDIHSWVYHSNAQFRLYGKELIRSETIVLSHHLPSPICTPSMYKNSTINRFFVSDETELILDKEPRLWVFGHTHHAVDVMLGKTRLVANPYGYPQERKFMPKYKPVVFEI